MASGKAVDARADPGMAGAFSFVAGNWLDRDARSMKSRTDSN